MRARVRESDNAVLAVWADTANEPAIEEGERVVHFPGVDAFKWHQEQNQKHGGKGFGSTRLVDGDLVTDPPAAPRTIAQEIRDQRRGKGQRLDDPVSLEELEEWEQRRGQI